MENGTKANGIEITHEMPKLVIPKYQNSEINYATGDFYDNLRDGIDFRKNSHNLNIQVLKTSQLSDEPDTFSRKIAATIFCAYDPERIVLTDEYYFTDKNRENFILTDNDSGKKIGLGQVKYHEEQKVAEMRVIDIDKSYSGGTGRFLAHIRMLWGLNLGMEYGLMKSVIPRSVKYILGSGGRTPIFSHYGPYPENGKTIIESVDIGIDNSWLMNLEHNDFYSMFKDFVRTPLGIPEIDEPIGTVPPRRMIVFLNNLSQNKDAMEAYVNHFLHK
jgi:hypothetical protein